MTLFLGGPLHGQYLTLVGGQDTVVVPVQRNLFRYDDEPDPIGADELRTVEYERKTIALAHLDEPVNIFVPKGWAEHMVAYSLSQYLKTGPRT